MLVYAVPMRPEKGVRSPGARVTGSCESPTVGAENKLQSPAKAAGTLSGQVI